MNEQLEQLKQLYKSRILDWAAFEAGVKNLGFDIKDAQVGIIGDTAHFDGGIQQGDQISIESGEDVAFAKDHGKAVNIKNSQVGVSGDNATVRDINIYNQGNQNPDPAEIRQTYLNTLIKSLKHLPLRGIDKETSDPAGNKDKLELDRVYVELDTKTRVKVKKGEKKGKDEFDLDLSGDKDTRPLSALEAAVNNQFLVILGDPGSGKSTFMNHLTFCLALQSLYPDTCDRLSCWPKDKVDIIPIPVVLRDFAGFISDDQVQAEEHHLWDFIESRLKSQKLDSAVEWLEKCLDQGKAVVLLDGLDEVPTAEKRGFIRDAASKFAGRYDKSRFIVTCRVLSYQDEKWQLDKDVFPVFELAPFDEKKIDAFISAWYEDLRRLNVVKTPEESEELVRRLKTAVRRPDLWRLAPNPLLLTVMALVHTHKGRLPDARALLYEETVDILLWRWDQVKISGQKSLPRLQELLLDINLADVDLKKLLWKLAFEAHGKSDQSNDDALADIKEWDLNKALAGLHPRGSKDWADQIIETIKMRAGLLLEREPGVYSFPHRTFQEYLSGAFLSSQAEFAKTASTLIESGNFWREVVLLAVGRLVYLSGDTDKPMALVSELCPPEIKDNEISWRKVWMAGEVLVEIGMNRVKQHGLSGFVLKHVQDRLTELIEKGRLTPKERVAAGNALSRIGDPRFDPGNYYLPADKDMGFVTVPAGEFLMGSDKKKDSEAFDSELPQHSVRLSEYKIARYPVTVAQYKVFAKETGLNLDGTWKRYNTIDNHPVVSVSWNDSVKYCEWLTKKLKEKGMDCWISLPTEAQWEKAARGTGGHIYPWGNETIMPDRANYLDTGIGTTSPVGCFPGGAGVYGLKDMIGNVWEWCYDWYGSYSPGAVNDPVGPSEGDDRVLRGGSWLHYAQYCRSAMRSRYEPGSRDHNLGFRLLRSYP